MVLHWGPLTFHYIEPTIPDSITVLAIGISFLGAYMTICFCEQFRLSKVGSGKQKSKLLSNNAVFFLMACALGGVGSWAMNFINLSGMVLIIPFVFVRIPIYFYIGPTVISLVVSIIFSLLGLYVASKDAMFAKTKQQIVQTYLAHSSKLSFKEIQKITNAKMLFIISTQSMSHIVLGGFICGSGTITTVCLAFHSIQLNMVNIVWNIGTICGATVLSWFVSILAFWILFRLLSLYPHLEWLRLASAGLMAFNVFIVRAIAYGGLIYRCVPEEGVIDFAGTPTVTQDIAYQYALICSVIFCFILVITAFSDLRMWLYDKSAKVTSLETLVETLKKDTPHNAELVAVWEKKYQKLDSLSHGIHSSHLSENTSRHSSGAAKRAELTSWKSLCCCFSNAVNPSAGRESESRNDRASKGVEDTEMGMSAAGSSLADRTMRSPRELQREESVRRANDKALSLRIPEAAAVEMGSVKGLTTANTTAGTPINRSNENMNIAMVNHLPQQEAAFQLV